MCYTMKTMPTMYLTEDIESLRSQIRRERDLPYRDHLIDLLDRYVDEAIRRGLPGYTLTEPAQMPADEPAPETPADNPPDEVSPVDDPSVSRILVGAGV